MSSTCSTTYSTLPLTKHSINHPSIDHDISLQPRSKVRRSVPTHSLLERSFASEPLPEKIVPLETRYARSDEGFYVGRDVDTHDSEADAYLLGLADDVFSDPPSETRQRLELSLSNIRRLQSRPNSRVSYISEKQEITPSDARWEKHMMDHIDMRYQGVMSSLDERFKALEDELQVVQNNMQHSKLEYEQLQELCSKPMVDRDVQTMLEGPVVGAEETLRMKQKMKTLEATMADLESSHDKDWKSKAKVIDTLQSFVDRVDNIMWETPYLSTSNVCSGTVKSFHYDDLCETHRIRYEKELLEASRDKTEALHKQPYTPERLDATFERLVRWSHAVRQHTQPIK